MKLPRRKFLYLAASAVPLSSISRIARAQTYPARPVRVIIPYAPGGPTDVFGRLMAQKLSEQLGKQFYVENMGGGGGTVQKAADQSVDRDDAFRSRARRFMRGGR
jgi:tripartite-type tricarboxylate transporter receptor subunit TctC